MPAEAGFGVSTSTAWRHVHQAELLAAPKPERALRDARARGEQALVPDGGPATGPYCGNLYCGKHRRHGVNLQAIATLKSELVCEPPRVGWRP